MIEVEQAVALLRDATAELTQAEEAPLLDALGRVLAEDLFSPIGVPPFPKAAMDGYALRSEDSFGASRETPVTLQVTCEIDAGDDRSLAAAPFTAARIMTGGVVPPGYDCIIKQENTDLGSLDVRVYQQMEKGENYIPAQEDIRKGQLVFPRRTRLRASHIGMLASMGFARVGVLRPFRVALIATGSELARPGGPLGPAKVYDSNSYLLASYLRAEGVELGFFETCPDEPSAFRSLVDQAVDRTDLVITTGGVSVGRKDIVAPSLESMGAKPLFTSVYMKPGTPVLARVYRDKPVLCLSGSPFASLVNFHVFFWPILAKATGCADFGWQRKKAVLREGAMKPSGLRRFVRARIDGSEVYLYTKDHRASVLSNLPESNCLIDQPPDTPIAAGDTVEVFCSKE